MVDHPAISVIGRSFDMLMLFKLTIFWFIDNYPLDLFSAAPINDLNKGCGSNGLDFNSGWNCTPTNQGWLGISRISGSKPSGEKAENIIPFSFKGAQ